MIGREQTCWVVAHADSESHRRTHVERKTATAAVDLVQRASFEQLTVLSTPLCRDMTRPDETWSRHHARGGVRNRRRAGRSSSSAVGSFVLAVGKACPTEFVGWLPSVTIKHPTAAVEGAVMLAATAPFCALCLVRVFLTVARTPCCARGRACCV